MKIIESFNRSSIPPGIVIPYGEMKLAYTHHARKRMEARTKGSLAILPKMIVLAEKNLKQIWTSDGKLKSMLVEIPYSKGTLLQLIISSDLVVITLYFRETLWQRTNVRHAEARHLESIASDTSPRNLLPEHLPLDERGQVIYPEGTRFPRNRAFCPKAI